MEQNSNFGQQSGQRPAPRYIQNAQKNTVNGYQIFEIPVGSRGRAWGLGAFKWKEIMKELAIIKEAYGKIQANAADGNFNLEPLSVTIPGFQGGPDSFIDLKNDRIIAIVKHEADITKFLEERDQAWKAAHPRPQQQQTQ